MERREHYDPEDIERLLQERGFEELLEEERAYVLRHLESRDEYESMRSLLHQMRAGDGPDVQADGDVREHVMRAYRQEHRPRWQIWLNSVGALLRPEESWSMPFLRPALTLASLALLIVAGIWVANGPAGNGTEQPLAELKVQPVKEKAAEERSASARQQSADSRLEKEAPASAAEPQFQREAEARVAEDVDETTRVTTGSTAPVSVKESVVLEDAVAEESLAAERTAEKDSYKALSATDDEESPRPSRALTAVPESHVVTEQELSQNVSLANASGRVRAMKKAERETVGTGTLAESPEILSLLAAGW